MLNEFSGKKKIILPSHCCLAISEAISANVLLPFSSFVGFREGIATSKYGIRFSINVLLAMRETMINDWTADILF